jgi:hypothetical protein
LASPTAPPGNQQARASSLASVVAGVRGADEIDENGLMMSEAIRSAFWRDFAGGRQLPAGAALPPTT